MYVLGISAFYHDSAAVLLQNGSIIAAAQEERFTRLKHDQSFPKNAIKFCLSKANIEPDAIDYVAFYDKPILKFERLLETYLAYAPTGFKSFSKAMPVWLKEKLFQKHIICKELEKIEKNVKWKHKILFAEHHESHAASAFFPSPYNEAIILSIDGVGEWATTSVYHGHGSSIDPLREIVFPHSLGLLYSAFTFFAGFKVNSGEYKLMGLAPYGSPVYEKKILDNLIDVKEDGSFRLNQKYFDYSVGLRMTNQHFSDLFDGAERTSASPITQREMDLAASIQKVLEDVVLKIATNLAKQKISSNLCLAGGVALNCVANSKLLSSQLFENIWVQPAAGDAGGALGCAYLAHFNKYQSSASIIRKGSKQSQDSMRGSYLGPEYAQKQIEKKLKSIGAKFELLSPTNISDRVSDDIIAGKAIGWFQGRMEFGPRALGNRSIIADARSEMMQKNLNLKIKFRESFRPFAPAVLEECVADWFEIDRSSPYMLFVAEVNKTKQTRFERLSSDNTGLSRVNECRSEIPAVTHVDFSARVQTVSKKTNKKFHDLISKFYEKTGCPVVVNTSFNVRGEPIVCTPEDAFKCFMGTELDILVVGNCYLNKCYQDKNLINNYRDQFELD